MIYVDSKVPLLAYRKASSESDPAKRVEFLEEHDIFIPTKTHAPMTVEEIAR